MLINFCQKRLHSTVHCSTVSNDGYEVTNLINDSDKGFLAYSCIKPPIHIDFTFICNIRVSRVLIWPSVGAQKSSGFELCVKSSEEPSSEYKKVSAAFLSSNHSGVFFYRRDINECNFGTHPNFLQRYIQVSDSQVVDNVKNLRISILRTENSVPAIGCIEIWGRVSKACGKETMVNVHSLWENNGLQQPKDEVKRVSSEAKNAAEKNGETAEEVLNVPESFLDPITWSIMIQPIVLPSGVTIDQSTLEKHGKTEATWGRGLSDPFTGIPFSDTRKPVVASALKARIDKFLLDNKHAPDVKSLPRLSGYKQVLTSLRNRSVKLSELAPEFNTVKNISNSQSTKSQSDQLANRTLPQSASSALPATRALCPKIQEQTRVHRLPVIPMCSKRAVVKRTLKMPKMKPAVSLAIRKEINSSIAKKRLAVDGKIESNLDHSVQTVLSNLQRFDEKDGPIVRECLKDCNCSTRIFYKLPCNHVVCKDVLMSTRNSQCATCGRSYSSRDPERVHTSRID